MKLKKVIFLDKYYSYFRHPFVNLRVTGNMDPTTQPGYVHNMRMAAALQNTETDS